MSNIKKGIVVCLLAAALLVSMVGMASATSHTWYMTKDASDVPTDVDYWMKTGGSAIGTIDLNAGDTKKWIAENPSEVDCQFCGATAWDILLDYEAVGGGCPGYISSSETITAWVGIYHTSDHTYEWKYSDSHTGPVNPCAGGSSILNPEGTFVVPDGDYLALKLSLDGGGSEYVRIGLGFASGATSPECSCDYPYPELNTLVLLGVGLLTLVGYMTYRRRNDKK